MRHLPLMPLDTVKLRSPVLDEKTFAAIERVCVRKQGIELSSGATLYQFTSGSLAGSWDSRVSLRPMRTDWIKDDSGRVRHQTCPPYVIVECSAAKFFFGQNVYGGPTDFVATCVRLIQILELLLGVRLPDARVWHVRRADWAETFALPYIAIQEYFEAIQSTYFPRRKMQKYGDHAIYVPGCTTTVKLYHKGREFALHDFKRIRAVLAARLLKDRSLSLPFEQRQARADRFARALQRLANCRLRAEVEVHADKLDYDFGHRPPVEEVTDEYLKSIFDNEMERLLREGRDSVQLARTSRDVASRLLQAYGRPKGHRLHGFWCVMASNGESYCKREYSLATFYRCRKALQDAGVSWHNTDVQIGVVRTTLPRDFAPIRSDPRRCECLVRDRGMGLLQQQDRLSNINPPRMRI